MFDVWSVIGGMLGGSLLFAVSGVGSWLKEKHEARKRLEKYLAQQERIRARKETNKNS